MPAQYNLAESAQLGLIEDHNRFEKLQFWLTMLEAKQFPTWNVYDSLFGTINWQPNMGPTMRGVRAEHTPVGRAHFFPQSLQSAPHKDVFSHLETTEDTQIQWHDFDSNLINFLGPFQDFRTGQIRFQHDDIVRQITIANDFFIRSYALQKAPYIYVAGNTEAGEDSLIPAPVVPSGTLVTEDNLAKTAAWWQAQIAKLGNNLSLSVLDHMHAVFRDDIGAPFFDGTPNPGTAPTNDLLKGRYAFIGSSEAFQQLKWDPNFSQFRDINIDIVTQGFRGSIFGELTWRTERYPLRLLDDGTAPAPEIIDNTDNRTRPNPTYTNAPNEVGFLIGADAFRTLRVGPPPSEFRKTMDKKTFYSMNWNGEVQLTDQVILNYPDGNIDLNVRGRFVKFISTAHFGAVPVRQANFLPVLFKRQRPGTGIPHGAR